MNTLFKFNYVAPGVFRYGPIEIRLTPQSNYEIWHATRGFIAIKTTLSDAEKKGIEALKAAGNE